MASHDGGGVRRRRGRVGASRHWGPPPAGSQPRELETSVLLAPKNQILPQLGESGRGPQTLDANTS